MTTSPFVTTPELLFSIGHILFSHPDGQKATLVPPLKGHGQYSKFLNWIRSEATRSEFVPSIPPSLAAPSEREFQNLHRLTYRTSGISASQPSQKVLKFEVPLEPHDAESAVSAIDADLKHVLRASGPPRMWTGYRSKVNMLIPHRSDSVHTPQHPRLTV